MHIRTQGLNDQSSVTDRLQVTMEEFRSTAKAYGNGVRKARAHPRFMLVGDITG